VVVRVGNGAITKAAVLHWATIGATKQEVPQPPGFSACIIRLRKKEQIDSGGEGRTANLLKEVCKRRYEQLLQTAVSILVNDLWLIEEAAREGIKVDPQKLAQNLAASHAMVKGRPLSFNGYLAVSGRTLADLKFELEVAQLSEEIYKHAEAKTPKLTSTLLARFYAAHKHQFAVPEERDLYILHTKSEAAALQAKRQIQAGQSFASVVKGLHVTQPLGSKEGLSMGLKRTGYSEPKLIDAIFGARPGVLSGPVHLALNPAYGANGYYVFKVIRKIPAHQMPYSQALQIMRSELPQALHRKTLASFVSAYKRRWHSRTDCKAGYVVELCKQRNSPTASYLRDPFVL
jgi:foldase protein PrsA